MNTHLFARYFINDIHVIIASIHLPIPGFFVPLYLLGGARFIYTMPSSKLVA